MAKAKVDKLDLSLDDIIKASKQMRGGLRGRGRGRGRGTRGSTRGQMGIRRAPAQTITHNRRRGFGFSPRGRAGSFAPRGGNFGRSSKLDIGNLDFGVTDKDLRELFSEFGFLKKANVHYDESGRSLGTGEVFFGSAASASAAQKKYNGMLLDGRPMRIQVKGAPGTSVTGEGYFRGTGRLRGRGMSPRWQRSRGGRGRGGRGRGGRGKPRTEAELDAELEDYNSSTQTSQMDMGD